MKVIGKGGFSDVYLANDLFGEKKVAVKHIKDITASNYSLIKVYRELKINHELTERDFNYAPKLLGAKIIQVNQEEKEEKSESHEKMIDLLMYMEHYPVTLDRLLYESRSSI